MPKQSAGLLKYRWRNSHLEVFLVHPGGPIWANKDLAAWSIPKGEFSESEHPLEVAKREFKEETGFAAEGNFVDLGTVKQPSGKIVHAWFVEEDCDPSNLTSNTFQMEWPPRSGRRIEVPEVDRGEWFSINMARERILKGQAPFLDLLMRNLSSADGLAERVDNHL